MNKDQMHHELTQNGYFVMPDVLSPTMIDTLRSDLDSAAQMTREKRGTTHIAGLDPNESNIRVGNLPAFSPSFIELLRHPQAKVAVQATIGENYLVSGFSANNALPGALPMKIHSDQALVIPPPWLSPWAVNVIWCLDDVDEENGATRFLPNSHHLQDFSDLPADPEKLSVPFRASAGSFIAMEGRLWHTSGDNKSADRQRRLLFAYYTCDFIRLQMNWALSLPAEVMAGMDEELRSLFGLSELGNSRVGAQLTAL